jgi:hypothetical protein
MARPELGIPKWVSVVRQQISILFSQLKIERKIMATAASEGEDAIAPAVSSYSKHESGLKVDSG